jgi:hypothetical protein
VVTFALNALCGGALFDFEGLGEAGWRRQFGYGVGRLVITTDLFYAVGLPVPLFRLYILVVALVGFVYCSVGGDQPPRERRAAL